MKFIDWLVKVLNIEKPSDVLMHAGFSIIFLAFMVWCVTIIVQIFGTNPLLGAFMSVVTVAFTFIFSGLFLYQKGY
jgi:FtsH-binding integral membrane protein